jgi:hypothetical protein
MNDSKNDKSVNKVIQSEIDKNDLIILLQKVLNDYDMIDCKMKELLNSNNFDKETLSNIIQKLSDVNKNLNDCAKQRNKEIVEFLKIINN